MRHPRSTRAIDYRRSSMRPVSANSDAKPYQYSDADRHPNAGSYAYRHTQAVASGYCHDRRCVHADHRPLFYTDPYPCGDPDSHFHTRT